MNIKSIKALRKTAGVAEMWGKSEAAMIPQPIKDLVATKLKDVPDAQLDAAMDKLGIPTFIRAALKQFIKEVRNKGGEKTLPELPKDAPKELPGTPKQLNPAKPMPTISSSKKTIKISKSQWELMGKQAGWTK